MRSCEAAKVHPMQTNPFPLMPAPDLGPAFFWMS